MKAILLFILIFTVSCASKNAITVNFQTVILKGDSLTSFYKMHEEVVIVNQTEHLLRTNTKHKSIDFYNLKKRAFEKRIQIPFYFDAFNYISQDTIYVLKYEEFTLCHFDSQGNQLKIVDFNELSTHSDGIKFGVYGHYKRFKTIDNKFLMNIVAIIRPPDYYSYPTIGIYDINNHQLVKTGYFPDYIQNGEMWFSFYPFYCVNSKNEIVNSYAVSHSLFVYDLNGNLKKTVDAKSKFIDKLESLNMEKSYVRKFSSEYEITRSRYDALTYDKYRNLYYRVAIHSQDLVNIDGSVNEYNSNPWSIIILDSNFNIIDEVLMQANLYKPNFLNITKDGILIQKNLDNTESMTDLEYTLVRIKYR